MRIIAHIDMNSYFASVEQQANPFLRGRPVGVCAYLSENGCIIASSKEAKKRGVKTGCGVREARRLCPEIVLVENEPAKYRSTTEAIFNIFREYTDRIEPYSIDEAFLDLTGFVKTFADGEKILLEIRERVKDEVGEWLTCSGGLSWTRFLAKFASDITAADEYLVIDNKKKMDRVFAGVKMTEAWGIAERTEQRLRALGIYSLLDLKSYPVANLTRVLGKNGYYLWANVNGVELEGVRTQEEVVPKSIGHSYCVPRQTDDLRYISGVLMKLCEKTGRRLRAQNLEATRIYAGYVLKEGGSHFRSRRLPEPLFSTMDIFRAASGIVTEEPICGRVRLLAASVSGLRPYSGQLQLFGSRQKNTALSTAIDSINDRYGEYVVFSGRMWGMGDQAHDRVGYRKSVEIHTPKDDILYEDD